MVQSALHTTSVVWHWSNKRITAHNRVVGSENKGAFDVQLYQKKVTHEIQQWWCKVLGNTWKVNVSICDQWPIKLFKIASLELSTSPPKMAQPRVGPTWFSVRKSLKSLKENWKQCAFETIFNKVVVLISNNLKRGWMGANNSKVDPKLIEQCLT